MLIELIFSLKAIIFAQNSPNFAKFVALAQAQNIRGNTA